MRKTLTILALAAGTVLLPACGTSMPQPIGSQTAPIAKDTVLVVHYSFIPHTLTVRAGTTVTWDFNDGLLPHQVSVNGVTSPIANKGKWSYRFDQPGTYHYKCPLHGHMDGTVVVTG